MISDYGLTQTVDAHTRLDNTLDLVITNRPYQINRTHTLPGIADHEIVYTEMDIWPTRKPHTPRQVPLFHKADWPGFCQSVSELAKCIEAKEVIYSVEELWELISDNLQNGIQLFISHKTLKKKPSYPSIDKHLAKKICRRDRAYSRCKRTGILEECKFQSLKREVQRDLHRAYWSHVNDIVTPQESDPNSFNSMKYFWRFIKCKATDFNGVASLKVNGKLINDPKLKAEERRISQ